MGRTCVDAALEGWGRYAGKAYLFLDDTYVRFDWATGRVDADYPRKLDRWKLGGTFAQGVNAAMNGAGRYQGKAYFFDRNIFRGKGTYTRYDWEGDRIDPGYPLPLTRWDLEEPFATTIQAALDGRGPFSGKAYFFTGNRYTRYDWETERIDPGYPAPLSAWNLPPAFLDGIDAAVNGHGATAEKAWFFRGSDYVTYDWRSNRIDGAPRAISDGWPGCVEMLCAGAGAKKALEWIAPALAWLRQARDLAGTRRGVSSAIHSERYAALDTHFHLADLDLRVRLLPAIIDVYERIEALLHDPQGVFRFRTTAEAEAEGHLTAERGLDPGYASPGGPISLTRAFGGFGPLTQAAMVLHEAVHVVLEGSKDHAYEHHREAYAALTAELASVNASSYAAFAQHIFYGKDERYGVERKNE